MSNEKQRKIYFVIPKSDEHKTVEDIFEFLKKTYSEHLSVKNNVIEFCKSNEDFDFDEIKKKIYIRNIDLTYKERMSINDQLFEKFGFNYWDDLNFEPTWTKHKTYSDYSRNNDNFLKIKDLQIEIISDEDENLISEMLRYELLPCFENNRFKEHMCNSCKYKNTRLCRFANEKDISVKDVICSEQGCFLIIATTNDIHEEMLSKVAKISEIFIKTVDF